jgi:pSer/pThr/pTyr-binding forkhead associated (FHA) protein
MPHLFMMTPQGEPRRVELKPGENTLGRNARNDLVIDSIYASRRHAVIVVDPAFITIQDLGSQNGTLVNGDRVEAQALVNGDILSLGGWEMQFVAGDQEFSQVEALRLRSIPNWMADDDAGAEAPTAPDVPKSRPQKL